MELKGDTTGYAHSSRTLATRVRQVVPPLGRDRPLAPEITRLAADFLKRTELGVG
jgi:histidine ammonia-lyase